MDTTKFTFSNISSPSTVSACDCVATRVYVTAGVLPTLGGGVRWGGEGAGEPLAHAPVCLPRTAFQPQLLFAFPPPLCVRACACEHVGLDDLQRGNSGSPACHQVAAPPLSGESTRQSAHTWMPRGCEGRNPPTPTPTPFNVLDVCVGVWVCLLLVEEVRC